MEAKRDYKLLNKSKETTIIVNDWYGSRLMDEKGTFTGIAQVKELIRQRCEGKGRCHIQLTQEGYEKKFGMNL